jgi:hypothetical protein
VNLVRTGIWTVGRGTCRRQARSTKRFCAPSTRFCSPRTSYDIPVIFTFFAFLPETWGGENAYLDRALSKRSNSSSQHSPNAAAALTTSLGLHQRTVVLLAEIPLELPAQLRCSRTVCVETSG